jgi:hypothetical protein
MREGLRETVCVSASVRPKVLNRCHSPPSSGKINEHSCAAPALKSGPEQSTPARGRLADVVAFHVRRTAGRHSVRSLEISSFTFWCTYRRWSRMRRGAVVDEKVRAREEIRRASTVNHWLARHAVKIDRNCLR